jgi:hypothetical protein
MSNQVDKAFVDEFNAGFMHLSQQMESRFSGKVREESQSSESQFWDQLKATTVQKKSGRHSDTPLIHTQHDRRRCTLEDYEWADLVDNVDKIRMITDPAGDYLKAAVAAMNRAKDDEVILAHGATAYTGKKGATAVELPQANVLVACKADGTSSAPEYLNEITLRRAAEFFDSKEAANDGESKYIAVDSQNLYQGLLAEEEIRSADYNAIKALVRGEINSFMGFEFIRTERLLKVDIDKARYKDPLATKGEFNELTGKIGDGVGNHVISGSDAVLPCWVKNGMLRATGEDITTRVTERDDKSYSVQPFARMSCGSTRMEEDKCLEIIAKQV